MKYTQRDLELAERHVVTFEHFVKQHRKLLAESTWEPALKSSAQSLLMQLEAALEESRLRCEHIRASLEAPEG